MRKLACDYLATYLCIKCAACSSTDDNKTEVDADRLDSRNSINDSAGRLSVAYPSSSLPPSAASETDRQVASGMERLLVDIRDLLERNVKVMADERREKEKTEQMMAEWAVAAAVIDRICFILIVLFFAAGTAALVVFCSTLSRPTA